MLIITDSRQGAQDTQLCYQQLKKELEKLAMREMDLGFHVKDCEGHSISYNEIKE